MSDRKWAAIVYGRSYHLDFRFIAIPQDFGKSEIDWAAPYILATTQKARNLAASPRWSLFKNDTHCVVGVTCMVRDLIGKLGEEAIEVMAKDDLGRPLYVFVGYVTKLDRSKSLDQFPAYTRTHLAGFKSLYREIERVWLARDYDNRKPFLSEYQPLNSAMEVATIASEAYKPFQLNDRTKHPDRTFIWQKSDFRDCQLWLKSSQCPQPTSICLNINKNYLLNSPFLNQTVTKIEEFTIKPRIIDPVSDNLKPFPSTAGSPKSNSFSQKISTRARADIDLTIQQAAKITAASQDLINNLGGDWSKNNSPQSDISSVDRDDFGFKSKEQLPSNKQDWF